MKKPPRIKLLGICNAMSIRLNIPSSSNQSLKICNCFSLSLLFLSFIALFRVRHRKSSKVRSGRIYASSRNPDSKLCSDTNDNRGTHNIPSQRYFRKVTNLRQNYCEYDFANLPWFFRNLRLKIYPNYFCSFEILNHCVN